MKIELPCGCIPGDFDCPEAVKLWREVNYQYATLKGQPTSFTGWADYDKALSLYRAHKRRNNIEEAKLPAGDGSITRTLPCTECRFNGNCSWQPHRKLTHPCTARSTQFEVSHG